MGKLKFTKSYTKLRNPERKIDDVNEEMAKAILYSPKRKKDWMRICRDDGRAIIWFRNEQIYEQAKIDLANNVKEYWYKTKEQKFSFSDENDNYNIWIAEFKTESLLQEEEEIMWQEKANAYFGIKEDTGRYSVHDVYTPAELGISVKY